MISFLDNLSPTLNTLESIYFSTLCMENKFMVPLVQSKYVQEITDCCPIMHLN